MKKETLEKIRNFLEYLFVLFMSILIMLITFGSLHVHAGFVDSIPDNYNAVNMSAYNSFCLNDGESSSKYPDYPYNISENITMYVPDDVFVGCYQKNDYSNFNVSNGPVSFILLSKQPFTSYYYVSGGSNDGKVCASVANYNSTYGFYAGSTIFKHSYGVDGQSQFDYSHVDDSKFSHTIFRYSTDDELYQYFSDVAAGKIDNTNKPDIDNPDFEDTAYAFTGFTANNKMTATWTGTTERSYLQNQEVEEYVRVNYYFADKEAQDTIKQADAYPDEFATADKTLTIDVSGLKSDDENWFLRYIRITPCYRQAGLGAWGDFYHGEPSYVYFNQDGSIDRIDAPYIKGELSIDMERPVIVLHEAANGNPTESDFSYFEFNNAQSDYFFEMKGRWYTTNDFDLYRDKLVWKYKYSTLLKNNLSTWVSVSDNRSSVGRFQFDVLGKSSWDNLLSSYPVDDRNYIGGSYNLFNKITGYSDALETLKMLLKQPYSLFNGYEVYVRYFRYDENGGIQYSKWTHFYNNLADSDGSSGSRLDDLDNMYSENQSDKGLTDDELSDLENGGNSRNDLDAVPKNNYDYSSLENATMNFFDLLKNFGTMLGQFPSMVAAVFGFLPPWLIGLIAIAIGAVIVCRFIGR